ncbi:hypothetical protein [Anabaena sp. FACHB-1237]|nr:hypothetical protein [Anabaena sp. FACHB-1237]
MKCNAPSFIDISSVRYASLTHPTLMWVNHTNRWMGYQVRSLIS